MLDSQLIDYTLLLILILYFFLANLIDFVFLFSEFN